MFNDGMFITQNETEHLLLRERAYVCIHMLLRSVLKKASGIGHTTKSHPISLRSSYLIDGTSGGARRRLTVPLGEI
jgi:hypothetical protein